MSNTNFSKAQAGYFDEQSKKTKEVKENEAGKFEFEVVLSQLDLPPGSAILEFGCGTGRYSLKLLELGYNVFGVDISQSSLNKLKEFYNLKKRLGWGNLVIGTVLPERGEFDACVCINILHHIEKPKEEILRIRKLLKKGGKILIFEPNPLCFAWYLLFLFKGILPLEKNIVNSSVKNLKKILRETGFEKIKSIPYGFIPTRLIYWSRGFLKLSSVDLVKFPLLGFFSFHNIVKAEIS